ncbi:GSK3-beta interaction protein [Araneus ventricosus]|uniref:GSK3-beta interaction protein n=1 Tax=Araneus ventricosus TaxID=182803 RepID=A0A4Y2I4Y5_ARAVE|nr:GSK3-beta interaction protein [Araneus ventricosus]GBM72216.1 GSK3-beta interaction protein [Araneus ventricosus]
MTAQDVEQCIDWREEAQAVIRDVGFALKNIAISSHLPQSSTEIYFNVETKEGQKFCVELSSYGFRVVSDCFDRVEETYKDQTYYETPYALLDKYSSQFRECFAAALVKKLSQLSSQ